MEKEIKPGRYRHYKGNVYNVLFVATHSETLEPMVVYQALYGEHGIWVRLASMWNEAVELCGIVSNRFEKIQRTRQRIIIGNLTEMLRQGKQAGVYDAAIDEDLAAHVLVGAADHFTQGNVLTLFDSSPEQLFRSILNVILKGCLTPEYCDSLQ